MAKGGKSYLRLDNRSVDRTLEVVMRSVERGTKKATTQAVKDIYEMSIGMVPRDTNNLAKSAFYSVEGNYKTGFQGVVGYGGNGNPLNPKSGKPASSYMIEVHEDLTVRHKVGGAKFLEIPVREYQMLAGARIANILREDLK